MKQSVICFTRLPRPGQTKTRLLPLLTPEQCAALHRAFLGDLRAVYNQVPADLYVAYAPDPDWSALRELFPAAAGFFPQEGADLGQRMHHAICRVLELGYDRVVLTGTDLPLLQPGYLTEALASLDTSDVVIGPTPDGGYYLIGMKQPHPEAFQVSCYGGAYVYQNTLSAIVSTGFSVSPAPKCPDVDTPEDLRKLNRHVDPHSQTGQYLKKLQREGVLL